ncbi:MAG: RHS repeat-associated core domain-containing protein [Candidatus Algichlamydia australiensis]|nr:RHS repeat-associated core domain-containing protein [Chlamydiales bacterium]
MKTYFFSFLCFLTLLANEQAPPSILPALEGEPAANVDSCVSAISGAFYVAETDIVVPGRQPIAIQRILKDGEWKFFLHLHLLEKYKECCNSKGKDRKRYVLQACDPTGTRIKYYPKHHSITDVFYPSESSFTAFTNTSRGALGGRTNPRNRKVTFDAKNSIYELHLGDGTRRYYGLAPKRKREKRIRKKGRKFVLIRERLANGNQIKYCYDSKKRPIEIRSTNPSGDQVYAWVKIKYYGTHNPSFFVRTSDEHSYLYHYKRVEKTENYYLDLIFKDGEERERIQYKDPENLVIKGRSFGGDRFVGASFYPLAEETDVDGKRVKLKPNDPRTGRVKVLRAPNYGSGKQRIAKKFFYHLTKEKDEEKRIDRTDVKDFYGNRVTYHYTDKMVLTGMDYHDTRYKYLLFERYFFEKGFLKSKLYKDGKYKNQLARAYVYDEQGNVLEDQLYGNLSGECQIPLEMEKKMPLENGIECFKTAYQYNKQNLIQKKIESHGREILYYYLPDTDLIVGQLVTFEGEIKRRKIFKYDENHLLVESYEDDGSSFELDSVAGVTQRSITRYHYWDEGEGLHLPKEIATWYWEKGEETFLGKVAFAYNQSCQVTKKETYDAEGKFCFAEEFNYDRDGNQIYRKDPLGYEIRARYDKYGNKIREREVATNLVTKYRYNAHNQLVAKEEVAPGTGEVKGEYFKYNCSGYLYEKRDELRNVTRFANDFFGNVRKCTYPGGEITETAAYNFQNKPIEEIDANGNCKKTAYNARGKPIAITHPDNTRETFTYYLHGKVKTYTDRMGRTTTTTYDYDLRPLVVETRSLNGELLSREESIYDAFQLLSKTNHVGLTTEYSYDGAGRKIEERFITPDGEIVTKTEYDSRSRPFKTTLVAEDSEAQVTIKKYDDLGRVIEERDEDAHGKVFKKAAYVYDSHGNKTQVLQYINENSAKECFQYDVFDRLITHTNSLGYATHIQYKKIVPNKRDPITLQKITTGVCPDTVETYDQFGRVASKEISNENGERIFYEEYYYDGKGQLVEQFSHVCPTDIIKATLYVYDADGQIVRLEEASGSEEQRVTHYSYNPDGNRLTLLKPDGTSLYYTYDAWGREKSIISSHKDIHYELEYDLYGNLIEAKDLVQGTSTTRQVNALGFLLSEKGAHGHTIRYETNTLGQRKTLHLPDHSAIKYRHDAFHMRKILRYNAAGKKLYTHRYDDYNLSGSPQSEKLICNLGESIHQFDPLRREVQRISPFHYERYEQFDPSGNLLVKTLSLDKRQALYTYDLLNQLVEEQGPWEHTYTCDSHNNRIEKDDSDYETDQLNQLHATATAAYTYDANGNPISKNGITFEYDSLDRLTRVTTPTEIYNYTYDYFHRRLIKNTTHYLFDGDNEIGSIQDGEIQELRILGLGRGAEIGAAIAIELGQNVYLPLHSIRGDLIALVDPKTKQIVTTISYSAFGEHLQKGEVNSPWLFQSKRLDPETGFFYFGRRFYEPETGRFITPDPKGFTDIPNLYHYVLNNPLILMDLYGLEVSYESIEAYNDFRNLKYQIIPYVDLRHPAPLNEFGDPLITKMDWETSLPASQRSNIYSLNRPELPGGDDYTTFNNGILTDRNGAEGHAKHIANFNDDYNVRFVHNASQGGLKDAREARLNLYLKATEPVYKVVDMWRGIFTENPSAQILHFTHSQGAIHTTMALILSPAEWRKRITVVGIAPALPVSKDLCKRAVNYRSRDFVPWLGQKGFGYKLPYKKGVMEILRPHADAPMHDHSFQSPTFRNVIKSEIENRNRRILS